MENFKQIQVNQDLIRHNHDGMNSEKVWGGSLINAPVAAITSANMSPPTSADAAIITNMRIRINELEAVLKKLGLLK